MYQGKFDSKKKQTSVNVSELVAQRNAAPQQKAAPTRAAAPAPVTPAPQAAPARKQKQAPVREPAPQAAPERRGPRLGSVIFYTFYFMFILLFFAATYFGLNWFHGWLCDYEAAQPTVKSQEVFDQLFGDPDWGKLYDLAKIEDTEYEGKDAFVSYMEEKVAGKELNFMVTSSGLATDQKKYIVKLGEEKLGTFTLKGETAAITDIPEWNFYALELFYEREESYRIRMMNGQTAYVNGVALGDDFTIQIASTKAESSGLLPIGTAGTKVYTQEITGLMAQPTVTIKNADGSESVVTYDPDTRTFATETVSTVMSDEEKDVALNAIKTYAKYQIKEASTAAVSKYFDAYGDAYKSIMETVLTWTKGNAGYTFANDSLTGYARYSDTMFSVYAATELTINLTDGGTQVKTINATLLFQKQNGSWKVTRMTNADISEPVGEVRLTYKHDDLVLETGFVDNNAKELKTPLVSAPEGMVFVGWMAEMPNEAGEMEWSLVFTPEENGLVEIPYGTVLEPMTLYAYFEAAGTANTAATTEPTEGVA